jgi:hypothetical protein
MAVVGVPTHDWPPSSMAQAAAVMAMAPGAEVYLGSGAAAIGQWPTARPSRFLLSSAPPAAQHPYRAAPPIAPVLSVPVRPSVPGAIDPAKGVSSAPSSLASTTDEGFFRKRRGEGRSSGGGPSSISFSQRGDASSSIQSFASPSDVSSSAAVLAGLPQPRSQGSMSDAPASMPTSPVLSSKDLPCVAAVAVNGRPLSAGKPGQQVARRSLERRSPRGAKQASEGDRRCVQPTSAQSSSQKAGLTPWGARNGDRDDRSPMSRTSAGRRGVSEDLPEPSRSSDGLKLGRRGEGRSSGGGPSQISLGSTGLAATSRSTSVDRSPLPSQNVKEAGQHAWTVRSPGQQREPPTNMAQSGTSSPQYPASECWQNSGMRSPAATRQHSGMRSPQPAPPCIEPGWPSMPDSHSGVTFTDVDGQVRPSYDELLAENRYLREELAEVRNELQTYRRWYT